MTERTEEQSWILARVKSSLMRALLPAAIATALTVAAAVAQQLTFRSTVTGEALDLNQALEEGRDTDAVRHFLATGENIYNENPKTLPQGEELFLTACSGCHGHFGEGKIGPGLNDDYWTYPKNKTDQGLFETIFGGAQAQMGPQYGNLTLDQMLLVMSWVRHLYTGAPETAEWLPEDKRAQFKPYHPSQSAGKDPGPKETDTK